MPLSAHNLSLWLDRSLWLRPAVLWSLTGLVALTGLGLAGALVVRDFAETPPADISRPRQHGPNQLVLAGSGSNVPLTERLRQACASAVPGTQITLDSGIGSTGGVRALREGVIDLALISRPLRPKEQDPALRVLPYARSPVGVAVHPTVATDGLRARELLDVFDGQMRTWRDGQPIVPLQREKGDSGHETVARVLPELAAIDATSWRSNRWRILYHDRAMLDAVLTTPGGIGLVDSSGVRALGLPLRLVAIDGHAPGDPAYPFWKTFAFVHRGPLSPAAQAFVNCVRSEVGQAVLAQLGALPP